MAPPTPIVGWRRSHGATSTGQHEQSRCVHSKSNIVASKGKVKLNGRNNKRAAADDDDYEESHCITTTTTTTTNRVNASDPSTKLAAIRLDAEPLASSNAAADSPDGRVRGHSGFAGQDNNNNNNDEHVQRNCTRKVHIVRPASLGSSPETSESRASTSDPCAESDASSSNRMATGK